MVPRERLMIEQDLLLFVTLIRSVLEWIYDTRTYLHFQASIREMLRMMA